MDNKIKMNVYERISNNLCHALENGVNPWRQTWSRDNQGDYISHTTGKEYSFLNRIMMAMQGKDPSEFITFAAAKKLGHPVKKGAKGATIYLYTQGQIKGKEIDPVTGEEREVVKGTYPVLKSYTVFDIRDCEGLEPNHAPEPKPAFEPIARCEEIAAAYATAQGIAIKNKRDHQPCYNSREDVVIMPERDQYANAADYYADLFHELTHSTGHASRLARKEITDKITAARGEEYSREELCAEVGSAFLCGIAGITNDDLTANSAAYLRNWLDYLKAEPKAFAIATARAQKAVEFITK